MVVTADAVKIGGGMGNIARSPQRADIYYDPSTPETGDPAVDTSEDSEDDDDSDDDEKQLSLMTRVKLRLTLSSPILLKKVQVSFQNPHR